MKEKVDAVIFIPFYEKEYDMLVDTIRSIRYYVKERHHIIAVDDFSPSRPDERLKTEFPDVTVMRNPKKHGGRSGLYVTQAMACKYAIEHFDFKFFIKMDTDALMVGPGLITKAAEKLRQQPRIGIFGSYRLRADNRKRNWHMWKLTFAYESSFFRKFFGKPVLWRQAISEARKNGYDLGENVLGGCYILNERCLKEMQKRKYLDYEYDNIIAHSSIGDEIIYSLFCKAAGFDIADFGRLDQPMAIALDVIPIPKEKIVADGKAVIHSVKKGLNGESQEELREYFRSFRK